MSTNTTLRGREEGNPGANFGEAYSSPGADFSLLTGERWPRTYSGVPWLGTLPVEWQVVPLKHVAGHVNRGNSPEYVDDSAIRVINQACIQWSGIRVGSVKFQRDTDVARWKGYLRQGDLLVNSTGTGTLGRAALFTLPGTFIADGHVTIIRPDATRLSAKYLLYLLGTPLYQGYIYAALVAGATNQIELSREGLRATPVPLPPKAEQTRIVTFLDKHTARVDGLIAKKQRLIALLQEKRAALISTAVTRGLDPDAPMRDSGIAWLGQIPRHWAIRRLKFLAPGVSVGIVVTPAKYYIDEGVPCLRSLNVKEGYLSQQDLVFISPESNSALKKSMIVSGDLVIVRTGQPGTAAVVDQYFDGANCIDLIIVRRSDSFVPEFLCYFMNSRVARVQFERGSDGAIQQHFNIETAKNIIVLHPSSSEQAAIVAYLNREVAKIETLVAKVASHVDRLREYRAALISAAVTGKIDVRGEGG